MFYCNTKHCRLLLWLWFLPWYFAQFSYFQRTRALVKFLHQMTNSVARSKPFQGNKKYNNSLQFYNLTRVTKGNIAIQWINAKMLSYLAQLRAHSKVISIFRSYCRSRNLRAIISSFAFQSNFNTIFVVIWRELYYNYQKSLRIWRNNANGLFTATTVTQ